MIELDSDSSGSKSITSLVHLCEVESSHWAPYPGTPVTADLTWFYQWSKWKAQDDTVNFFVRCTADSELNDIPVIW